MFHRLAHIKEGGDINNWVVIRYNYDLPQAIEVVVSRNESHQ
jgi:hypothetical protein